MTLDLTACISLPENSLLQPLKNVGAWLYCVIDWPNMLRGQRTFKNAMPNLSS